MVLEAFILKGYDTLFKLFRNAGIRRETPLSVSGDGRLQQLSVRIVDDERCRAFKQGIGQTIKED